jgi:ankyrin repeat protein
MSAGRIAAAPMPSPAAGEAAPRAAAQAAQARPPAELAAELRGESDAALRGPGDSDAALRRAAESGDMPRLRTLLGEPIAIDARDSNGRTALMLATLHGQQQAVDALLAGGADPNLADSSGTTPLQAAIAADRSSIAAALRRAGAR